MHTRLGKTSMSQGHTVPRIGAEPGDYVPSAPQSPQPMWYGWRAPRSISQHQQQFYAVHLQRLKLTVLPLRGSTSCQRQSSEQCGPLGISTSRSSCRASIAGHVVGYRFHVWRLLALPHLAAKDTIPPKTLAYQNLKGYPMYQPYMTCPDMSPPLNMMCRRDLLHGPNETLFLTCVNYHFSSPFIPHFSVMTSLCHDVHLSPSAPHSICFPVSVSMSEMLFHAWVFSMHTYTHICPHTNAYTHMYKITCTHTDLHQMRTCTYTWPDTLVKRICIGLSSSLSSSSRVSLSSPLSCLCAYLLSLCLSLSCVFSFCLSFSWTSPTSTLKYTFTKKQIHRSLIQHVHLHFSTSKLYMYIYSCTYT